jgi:hypothetical protein
MFSDSLVPGAISSVSSKIIKILRSFEKFEAVKKGTCANSFLLRATAVVVQ